MSANKCEHKYGKYRPNGEEGPVLVCSECGIELDVITRQPKKAKEA